MKSMFQFCSILLLLASGWSFSVLATAGDKRLKAMLDASYSQHIIREDAAFFKSNVLSGPRPYYTVVIFNALSARFQCPACRGIGDDTYLIADTLWNAQFKSGETPSKPVFLLEAEIDNKDIGKLFGQLGLKSAPLVVIVHPTKKNKIVPVDKFVQRAKKRDEFDFNARGFTAEAVVKWVNDKTGLDATVDRPIDWGRMFRETFVPMLAILLPLLLLSPILYKHRHDMRLYLAVSLGVYLFCVAGGMFNILKGTPWDHRDQNGVSYFHDGNGWQLGSESYLCGGLQLFIGILVVWINSVLVTSPSGKVRNMGTAAAVFSFVYLFGILRHVASRKMPGYNNGWVYQW